MYLTLLWYIRLGSFMCTIIIALCQLLVQTSTIASIRKFANMALSETQSQMKAEQ
jgi:hypothetical protein